MINNKYNNKVDKTYGKGYTKGMKKRLSAKRKQWIERTIANDRSYKLYLYNRFFIFLILALGQLAGYILLLLLVAYNSSIGIAVQLVSWILSAIAVLHLIGRTQSPSTKLNWILLIIIAPVVGLPLYIMYGEGRPTRIMNWKIRLAKQENQKQFEEVYGKEEIEETVGRNAAISRYLHRHVNYPAYKEGSIKYYKSGEEMFPAMLEELKKAESFILLDYFIIAHGKMWNSILEILLEKAALGVKIRIIYDDFGCMVTLPPKYDIYLEELNENIKCMTFNDVVPLFAVRMNHRDHRKILVVDGKVAFTGGVNISDEYIAEKQRFGYWKDSGVKITGPAVASFTKMFFDLWNAFRKDKENVKDYLLPVEAGGRCELKTDRCIQPYDECPLDKISVAETVYVDIIDKASKYVYIFTPYLVLDDFMRTAMIRAAMRGVDVRIVTPGIPDKKTVYRLTRANYEVLLKAGVKIYEYTPGFIHSKSVVSDDKCAVVGTINFDYRSLYHHFENAVYFTDIKAVAAVKRDCEETFAVSKECSLKYPKRSIVGRWIDALLRVLETLL